MQLSGSTFFGDIYWFSGTNMRFKVGMCVACGNAGRAVLEIWIIRILQQVGHLDPCCGLSSEFHRTRTCLRTDMKILENYTMC
jgi:hypothetical protein